MKAPSVYVPERIFRLDCARKYFTPEWIKRLIDEISEVGYNAITLHFAELNAVRLESKKFPWLAGADYTLCGFSRRYGMPENDEKYFTQAQMRDIVLHARAKGLDVIPSLDTPGHTTYIAKKYRLQYGIDIGNYFHKNGKKALVPFANGDITIAEATESLGIDIANPHATKFIKELYEEYGRFFHEIGCTAFDIGGDELLGWNDDACIDKDVPKWHNLEHWEAYARKRTGNESAVAHDAFILYMNDITALLKEIGYTSIRMWNDDVYRITDTGWCGVTELDKDIDIQYWSPHTNNGANTAKFYLEKGHNLYNFARLYTYYTLYPEKRAPSYTKPEYILDEWNPYVFAPNNPTHPGDNTYIFAPYNPDNIIDAPNERVKGAGFCLWCDCPIAETEDELLEHIRPYFTAIAKKSMI